MHNPVYYNTSGKASTTVEENGKPRKTHTGLITNPIYEWPTHEIIDPKAFKPLCHQSWVQESCYVDIPPQVPSTRQFKLDVEADKLAECSRVVRIHIKLWILPSRLLQYQIEFSPLPLTHKKQPYKYVPGIVNFWAIFKWCIEFLCLCCYSANMWV